MDLNSGNLTAEFLTLARALPALLQRDGVIRKYSRAAW